MAFCCCCCFFKDNLLFSKHLRLLLSRKGWQEALALVFPGRNMCSGFLETSWGSATSDKGSRQEVVCLVFTQASSGKKNDYSVRVETGSLRSLRRWRKRLLFLPKTWDSNRRSNFGMTLPMKHFFPPGLKASFCSKLINTDGCPPESIVLGEPEGTLASILFNPLDITEEETEAQGGRWSDWLTHVGEIRGGQHCRGPARLPAKGRDHFLDLRFCVLQSLTSIGRVAGVQWTCHPPSARPMLGGWFPTSIWRQSHFLTAVLGNQKGKVKCIKKCKQWSKPACF